MSDTPTARVEYRRVTAIAHRAIRTRLGYPVALARVLLASRWVGDALVLAFNSRGNSLVAETLLQQEGYLVTPVEGTCSMRIRPGVAELRQRLFTFSASYPAVVECRNCSWKESRRWRDLQRVFDLADAHECPGVETYQQMLDRHAREAAAERAVDVPLPAGGVCGAIAPRAAAPCGLESHQQGLHDDGRGGH